MPICANPEKRRIKVPVGKDFVILALRPPTTSEYTSFIGAVTKDAYTKADQAKVAEDRIAYVDQLLIGIEAQDSMGNPDVVTYRENEEEKPLTPEVPNWKGHVNPSWKLAASFRLEGQILAVEDITLKN